MSHELLFSLIVISILAILLVFLFLRSAHRLNRLSKKHLLYVIGDPAISSDEKQVAEKQLLNLLKYKPANSLKYWIGFSTILVVTSWILYLPIGSPNYSKPDEPQAEMSLEQAIFDLENRLSANPKDIEGQMLLARSQMTMKNYSKAVESFRKANEIEPNDSGILTELAEALALKNNTGSFLGEPEELIAQAVKLNPFNQKALFLKGMTHYERGDLKQTLEVWEGLYQILENEGAKQQLQKQLEGVRAQLNASAPADDNHAEPIKSNLLNLEITLSDELKKQLKSQGVLFVSIKEVDGMPMPIAAKRISLNSESFNSVFNVRMTDKDSLHAQRLLSSFTNVKVKAKISFSGIANASIGDFESDEIVVNLIRSKPLKLIIDKVLN